MTMVPLGLLFPPATSRMTAVSFADTALTSSNTIQFRVVDTAGNTGAVAEQEVTIDTTAPTTTITINSISDDSGSSDSDFITSDDDGLTINATLSQTLGAGETLEYSNDDGSTWSAVSSGNITGTDVSFADTARHRATPFNSASLIPLEIQVLSPSKTSPSTPPLQQQQSRLTVSLTIQALLILISSPAITMGSLLMQLSPTLVAGETLQYSNNDGSSWSDVSSSNITNDTAVSFTDSALTSSNTIQFRVIDTAGNTLSPSKTSPSTPLTMYLLIQALLE